MSNPSLRSPSAGLSSGSTSAAFIETLEYRRFAEFCDACRQYRYIGLCYGPPGVGKTLSARYYTGWDVIQNTAASQLDELTLDWLGSSGRTATAFCTASVINTPRSILADISIARTFLHRLAKEPLQREEHRFFQEHQQQWDALRDHYLSTTDWLDPRRALDPPAHPPYAETSREFSQRIRAVPDPTTLVLIDEAERLKMTTLEAARDLFDQSDFGLILIGMPGMEKRLTRFPQLYSRIGFVHEFRPLTPIQMRQLLAENWRPRGVVAPPLEEDAITAIIRVTGGNFRLLHRVLSQAERIARINELPSITRAVVNTARESLVIGQM